MVLQEHLTERLQACGIAPVGQVSLGAGLTTRHCAIFSITDLADAYRDHPETRDVIRHAMNMDAVGPIFERIKQNARRVLRRANLPDSDALVAVSDEGAWRQIDPDALQIECLQHLCAGLELAQKNDESEEWFAAEQLRLLAEIGPLDLTTERVARLCLALGAMVEREKWKRCHEKAAVRGYENESKIKQARALGTAATKQAAAGRRRVILLAAAAMLKVDPTYRNNLSRFARDLEAQRLEGTEVGRAQTPLGADAIRKILVRAFATGLLG